MKTYIGAKIIQAEPMKENEFQESQGWPTNAEDREGYRVKYPPGKYSGEYLSWSPKDVFETAYREVTAGEGAFFYASD